MPILTLRNVHLSYGVPLLDGVDLTVERGERVCVLGRNGAGKSTLLRVIAGEVVPDDGAVIVPAAIRTSKSSLRNRIWSDFRRWAISSTISAGLNLGIMRLMCSLEPIINSRST